MDAWRPDVVVRESCEFASAIAAEAREIPVARVGAFQLRFEALAVRAAAPAVDELRRWAGLEPDPAGERLADSPYLTLTPASFEPPGEPEPARTLRFHDAPPPLRAVRPPGEAPLVYMSFGSVAATIGYYPGLYRSVIDALAGLPIRLLVTVGDAADPAELGPLPANVRVERWIPQAQVFTRADAMVGHGGYGTTMGALLAGLPQVVVPLFADQPYNAQRIADLGAGLAADAQDPAGVRAAVERLLADPAHRVAAGRVALEAQALPSIDEAPAALQALAAAARRRRAASMTDLDGPGERPNVNGGWVGGGSEAARRPTNVTSRSHTDLETNSSTSVVSTARMRGRGDIRRLAAARSLLLPSRC